MSTVKNPSVKIITSAKSSIAPRVETDLVLGMVVNSPTGPLEKYKVNDIEVFKKKYLTGSAITANDDITMKNAAAILQFMPMYITRAMDNNVLAGITDKGNVIYTDLNYSVLKYGTRVILRPTELQYGVTESHATPIVYAGFKLAGSPDVNYLYYSNGSDVGTKSTTGIPASVLSKYIEANIKFVSLTELTIESLLSNINANLITGMPSLLNVIVEDYITVIPGVNCSLEDYNIEIVEVKKSNQSAKYKLINFAESYATALTQSKYMSINGNTFYNKGFSANNTIYPGTAIPLIIYGGDVTPSSSDDSISLDTFYTYMMDKMISYTSILDPNMNQARYEVTLTGNTTRDITQIDLIGDISDLVTASIVSHVATIETIPNIRYINNCGIRLNFNSGASILFYIGNVGDTNLTKAGQLAIACNVHTIQALVYRINESFSKSNDVKNIISTNVTSACVISEMSIYFNSLLINTFEASMPSNAYVASLATGKMYNYTISGTSLNSSGRLFNNFHFKFDNYVYYTGSYVSSDPDEELIRLSTVGLNYVDLISKLRREMNKTFKLINTPYGLTVMDADNSIEHVVSLSSVMDDSIIISDMASIYNNDYYAIVTRYPSNQNICQFVCDVDSKDAELYNLTLLRKDTSTDYVISFVPDKVDDYNRNVYFSYVNEGLTANDDFFMIRLGGSVATPRVTSRMFGSEVPVVDPGSEDYQTAFGRFNKPDGVKYNFLFDGGECNGVVAQAVHSNAVKLNSQSLLTMPDIFDVKQIASYRAGLGIDSFNMYTAHPLVVDTTVGDFVSYLSPCVEYLHRVVLNKAQGREFCPTFDENGGIVTRKPKYIYDDIENHLEYLAGFQINTIYFDKAQNIYYFNMDLSGQSADNELSESASVRMALAGAHVMMTLMPKYKGRYNDDPTRREVVSRGEFSLKARLVTNQEYAPVGIRLICNGDNNPTELVRRREMAVEVAYQFLNGTRYITVYQNVYPLTTNLNNL